MRMVAHIGWLILPSTTLVHITHVAELDRVFVCTLVVYILLGILSKSIHDQDGVHLTVILGVCSHPYGL